MKKRQHGLTRKARPKSLIDSVDFSQERQARNDDDCAEMNLCGMVDAESRVLEAELFAGKAFAT